MATYLERHESANQGTLRQRVRIAILAEAIAVIGENVAGVRGEKRHSLAMNVLARPDEYGTRFAIAILAAASDAALTSATQDSTAGDTALRTMITNGWDKIAGVRAGDEAA